MPSLSLAMHYIQQDKHIITLNHIALCTATLITIIILATGICYIYKFFQQGYLSHNQRHHRLNIRYATIGSIAMVIFICCITGLSFSKKVDLANVYNAHITNNNLNIRIHQKRFQYDKLAMNTYYTVSYQIKHKKIKTGYLPAKDKHIIGKNSPKAMLQRHTKQQEKKYTNKSNNMYKKELRENNYLSTNMSLAKPHKPHWYNYLLL